MPLIIDYSRMIPAFNREAVSGYRDKIGRIHEDLVGRRKKGMLPFYDLPYQDVSGIVECSEKLKGSFKNLVILGIGGSALGLSALNSALRSPYCWNEETPALYISDNIDPERIFALLSRLEPAETIINVITKSGSTAETMACYLVFRKWLLDALGEKGFRERMLVTTDKEKGALRGISEQERLLSFTVPDNVGGRFSVLSPVGLLPAALLGLDIRGLLAGAAEMDVRLSSPDLFENPAYLGAVLNTMGYLDERKISVMFAYADRLLDLADWYRQLWAESLGKRLDLDGAEIRVGPTPVKALGVTDQHSQLQLYQEGPDDKIFTFLKTGRFRRTVVIPKDYGNLEAVAYLGGRSLSELFFAEQSATEAALFKEGRPVTSITFPEITAETVGGFFYFFEVQTIAAGSLLRIDPLDQPGVEEGKHFAYGLMGRPGYEHKRRELDALEAGNPDLVFK